MGWGGVGRGGVGWCGVGVFWCFFVARIVFGEVSLGGFVKECIETLHRRSGGMNRFRRYEMVVE